MRLLALSVLVWLAGPLLAETPAEVIAACAADVKGQPSTTRYLSMHNLPEDERKAAVLILSGHLNHLSREPDITRPVQVGYLLRIDTANYGGTFAAAWEQLAESEPYFHVPTKREIGTKEETVEVGFWVRPDGTKYTSPRRSDQDVWESHGYRQLNTPVQLKASRLAPWLTRTKEEKAALNALLAATYPDPKNESAVPVVTAEWFLFQTAIQQGRKPGYYDFLGIKDEKTYQKLIGFTEKDIDPSFLREIRESVRKSGVTRQPRAIERHGKIDGSLWRTRDVKLAKDKSNPLRVLNNQLVFDATEQFGHLSNGLFAVLLADNKGVRQDAAPPDIASDSTTTDPTDTQVHIYLSCFRCHAEGGLKDIDGWVRNVINFPPNELLGLKDPLEAKKLRQQYARNLDTHLARDRQRYAEALNEACGLTPPKYSAGLADLWHRYAEEPVTIERAARDLGCTVDVLQKALEAQRNAKTIDPVLSAFIAKKPTAIPVTSWHEAYVLAQLAIGGVAVAEKK